MQGYLFGSSLQWEVTYKGERKALQQHVISKRCYSIPETAPQACQSFSADLIYDFAR